MNKTCTWCGKVINHGDRVVMFEGANEPYCSDSCADADSNSGDRDTTDEDN